MPWAHKLLTYIYTVRLVASHYTHYSNICILTSIFHSLLLIYWRALVYYLQIEYDFDPCFVNAFAVSVRDAL